MNDISEDVDVRFIDELHMLCHDFNTIIDKISAVDDTFTNTNRETLEMFENFKIVVDKVKSIRCKLTPTMDTDDWKELRKMSKILMGIFIPLFNKKKNKILVDFISMEWLLGDEEFCVKFDSDKKKVGINFTVIFSKVVEMKDDNLVGLVRVNIYHIFYDILTDSDKKTLYDINNICNIIDDEKEIDRFKNMDTVADKTIGLVSGFAERFSLGGIMDNKTRDNISNSLKGILHNKELIDSTLDILKTFSSNGGDMAAASKILAETIGPETIDAYTKATKSYVKDS